jgi:hypothetical protein
MAAKTIGKVRANGEHGQIRERHARKRHPDRDVQARQAAPTPR